MKKAEGTYLDYLRQTVDSGVLDTIFDLPVSLRNKKVDVIILPADENPRLKQPPRSSFGCLKKYANPSKLAMEDGAWERASAFYNLA
jgi:hypothetical protein